MSVLSGALTPGINPRPHSTFIRGLLVGLRVHAERWMASSRSTPLCSPLFLYAWCGNTVRLEGGEIHPGIPHHESDPPCSQRHPARLIKESIPHRILDFSPVPHDASAPCFTRHFDGRRAEGEGDRPPPRSTRAEIDLNLSVPFLSVSWYRCQWKDEQHRGHNPESYISLHRQTCHYETHPSAI